MPAPYPIKLEHPLKTEWLVMSIFYENFVKQYLPEKCRRCGSDTTSLAAMGNRGADRIGHDALLFSFAKYLAACCEDEGEENPP